MEFLVNIAVADAYGVAHRFAAKKAMQVQLAYDVEDTQKLTWQTPFKPTVKCVHCGGEARLAFVAYEDDGEPEYLCDMRPNGGEGDLWLHDACAVAVYFCKECLEPTAEYNQA